MEDGSPEFSVSTDQFEGPIDLLLYLVRRQEVEVAEVPLGAITHAYLEYLEVLSEIEIDRVGDFIEVAAWLVEIKSRRVLPRNEFESEADESDPRENLVERLLLYKEFKDAAALLEDQQGEWADRFARIADEELVARRDPANEPIREVELWDLVSAFGRVLRDNRPPPQENIVYDETPIQVYMKRIHGELVSRGRLNFSELFEPGMHKSAMVGIFLAVLELTRYHHVQADQPDLNTEIALAPGEGFRGEIELSGVDDYNPHASRLKPGDPGSLVE